MSADNRTKLYNALKSEGYTDIGGSQEEFNELIENPKNLRLVYDALKTSGYTDIGKDYAEFEGLMNPHYNPIAAQNPQAFAPEGEEIKPEQIVNGNTPTLKDTNRFQVSELSSRIEGLTAKRNKEIEEENRRAEEAAPWYARAMKNMARGGIGGAPTYAVTNNGRLNDNEYMTLQAAAKSMRNAQNIIAEADHNAKEGSFADWLERSFAGGAVRGLGKTLYDPHTWDMDVLDVAENSALLKALDAYEAGNSLTEAQQALLDAKAVELATNAYFGSEVGRGYKAGQVTAEAIPFMLEMAINPASTAGKGAVNALTRYALKRFGTKAAKKGISTAAKVATRVVGDVAGASAMAATTGAGNVAANTLERMAGDARYATDAAGRSSFAGTTNRENPATALAKSFGATTIENYSEMLGEYFAPVFTPIGKGLAKGLDKMKLGAVNRFIDDVKMSDIGRFVSDFEKQTQWSGVAGEYSEEVVGGVINALTVGDQTLDTDENTGVFNLEKNIETLTSVALMGGFMSSVKTLGYRTPVYRAQKQIDYADNAGQKMFEDWGDIKNKLDNDRSSLPFILMGANPEQRKVILDYYAALCNYNGVLRGKAKQEAEGDNTVNNSYDAGYATTDAQGMANIKKTMEGARAAISFLSDEAVQRLDENPVPTLELMESEGATDEELQAVHDYVNASAAYKGMVQRMNEEADEQTKGEQERLIAISNEEGMVQPVVLDNDTRAYIQKGTLDDEHIVVVDDNGVQSMVAPSTLRGVGNPYNAQESIQAMRDEYVNARLAELDNPAQQTTQPMAAQYNYNDEVTILDDNNQPVRATIASNADGDGRMQVETETPVNGKRVNYFTAEEINGRLYEAPGESQQTEQSAPTKEPIPMEKVGKEERPAYHLVPFERTLEELHGDADLTQQDIDAFITANITELQGEIKKVAEKEPKMGANIAKFKQDKIQWAEKQKALQAKLDYYTELQKRNAELESSELQEAYNAPGSVEGVTTPDEVVAGLLVSIKITPESFKRETGLSTAEQKGLVGIIANEDKGGVSVERAAEIIAENYSDELAASGYTGDVQGIRDMIISVLSDGNPRTYAKRGTEQRANEEAEERRREIEAWVAQFDMTVEEYFLYEQTMLPRVIRDYQGFDENEYYSILADEYNNSNYDTERESESVGRGREVLQGEQPVPARGAEPVGAGNEGGAVPSDVQGGTANGANEQAQSVNSFDALPSEGDLGAANGVAQEEIGQPVGISEQLENGGQNALQNGTNELNLQQENEQNNVDETNISRGGQVSQSVPQGEHRTQTPQIGGMEETAARIRERIEAYERTPQSGLSRDVREIENRVTREYAQDLGLWIPFDDVYRLGVPAISGNEHNNYLEEVNQRINKVNNRMNTPSILDLLDRMELHNKYFPESKYSLIGFTAVSDNGDVWPVFSQRYIPNAREASIEEIDAYMSALGFTPVGEARYTNGEIVVKDLRPRNVLADADGDIYVVDAEFEPAKQESGEKSAVPSVQEQIQAAEAEVNTNPTEAQKEAGNYKKGHVQIGTFNVTIEQPKGSVRSGVDADGKKWETEMQNTYGYIRGTEGVDGDHIDVFLSDDIDGWDGHNVFVVDQRNADGSFDEHKVMLGFNDINDAEAAYMSNYEEGWQGLGAITGVSIEEFEKWIASSHRKTKAFAEYKSVKTSEGQSASGLAEAPVKAETPTISQESEQVSDQDNAPYTIAPAQYTTKKGKVLDMHLVKFAGTLTKEQQRAAKELAKAEKGWYDREQGGFMMRSEDSAKQLAETIIGNEEAVSDAQPVSLADTRKIVETEQQVQPTNPSGNRLVTDERYAELRERMRKKLGGQMNIGIDPEILAIGTEMAVYHLEKGARKFTEYAKAMIADLGDAIRPYLKAFYNGARELPEVAESGLANDMTPYDEVQRFDVANFDKQGIDVFAAAETIVREQEVAQEVEVAQERIKKTRSAKKETKKKSVTSQQNLLDLFDNGTEDENTRTDNSGAQSESQKLPNTEQVGARTSVQHPAKNSESKRGNSGAGRNKLGDRPQYDVNKNYSNEEIGEIVSSITDIVDGKVVITGEVTDDIKAIIRGYKSGGVAKQGRGILDEYYTDGKIVDAVNMLIAPYFKGAKNVRVLEPSVGVGNFIEAVDNIPTSEIQAFEINDTTARIAKILYPGIDVNLRSFETEFIDESGNKKPLPKKFNLVIGNPPYGSHRGLYKGLGEESKISRYEDYFVKRSLDVLEDGGVLAMVLPSSWIDRHTKYGGYTIEAAYRLPSGAFEATQVGTDIVILKKDSTIPVTEHTPYFEQHPERVLGDVKERTGRYGRTEQYVEGNIDTALETIKREHAEQLAEQLDIEKSNDNLNDIEAAIEETGSIEKATPIVESEKAERKPAKKSSKPSKYKVELNRGVETVPTSSQFTHEFSEGEVEAFADTEYDGTLNNPTRHKKYANYIGGRAVHDFYYAEGDIYDKLAQLEREKGSIIEAYGIEQYNKQKILLESVLPKRKGLSEITVSPNTTFVKNLNIETAEGSVSLKDAFIAFCRNLPHQAFGDSSSWEVVGYVNNEQVHGTDKHRNQRVRERRKRVANDLFAKFLNEELSDKAKNQVVAAFNSEYNSVYRPDYSKVPIFSTINKIFKDKPLKLTDVQLAGIGRMTVKGVGVLAHEVGFGKTLSGILAMHEAMTRGFAKKPLIVVPNDNILKQWVETINEVLPQATVNTLGNLGAGYDLTDFKVNEGEFTIITYEGLKAMSFSDGTYNHLASKFSYITEDLNKHQSERDIQKRLEKTKELKGKMKRGAKSSYMFEDFGFDWLTVDEVHNANHIVSKVRLDKSVASDFRSQSQRTSDLGLKTWLAAQYIQEENNGRNVLLLSATPFTNKPLEYYSILSLVGNKMLERKGFFNVDQFFATFMEADNEMEMGANNRPVQKTNVRRFRNNGLFQQLLSEFIDIKGEEDNPELIRPARHNREYKLAQNDLTAEAIDAAQELLNDNDTVLQGIGHARAAAFSPYATSLLGAHPKNHKEFVKNSPKIDATIKMIEQNRQDRPDAGQIIYSEVGVEFFPMIRDYLVKESGFKPNEVRIITGATSNNERVNIQTAFNNGKVKVVIGSPAIKEGLNLQGNTTDMYILSLPWNFTQLRQIEGRGWRQGNKWENIRINYMLTNNSVDVLMLQRLQLKQGLYNEAMKSGAESLDVSDIDTAELKTALITDPAVRAEIVTAQEREKLQMEKTQIEADLSFVVRKYEAYNKLISKLDSQKRTVKQYREWAKNGDKYWVERAEHEEAAAQAIEQEIEQEKENLAKKGVNVDDIVRQTEQAQSAIAAIQERIDNLKEFQQELTERFRKENEAKEKLQGDVLATYLKERKAENNSGFYKIRPKENPKTAEEGDVYSREGYGPASDSEVATESDVYAKALGRPRYTGKKMREYVAKQRQKMVERANELAAKLHLDNVEVVTEEDKTTAKGFYRKSTDKITVVIPNHSSVADVEQTLLHEAVAHYGLRQLFGESFDTFLDNVYYNASEEIRAEIDRLAMEKYDGETRTATEEYLASLAENTNFENAERSSWWQKIKRFFVDMLAKAGVKLDAPLTDNELRYILWRSYENLAELGRYRSIIGEAADIAKQYDLGVGNYAPVASGDMVAERDVLNREGTPATEEFINATVVASNWGNTHKGAAPCIVIQSAETLRAQLEQAGFSAEDIADAEKDSNSCSAEYFPTADKVVIYNINVVQDEIIGYLWHENAHKAIGEIYTEEEVERAFKAVVGEFEQEVREQLTEMGYTEKQQAEEYFVQEFERMWLDENTRAMLERGRFSAKESAPKEYKIFADFIKPIIKYINNGGERGYNPDGGIRESDRENQGGYVGQHQESLEVRNSTTKRGTPKAKRGTDKTGATLTIEDGQKGETNRSGTPGGGFLGRNGQKDTGVHLRNAGNESGETRKGIKARRGTVVNAPGTASALYENAVRRKGGKGYQEKVAITAHKFQEAYQDSMLALDELQKAITAETGNVIETYENAYMAENAMSSRNRAEIEAFERDFYNPLIAAVGRLVNSGASYDDVKTYMHAKHGLERNRVFSKRDVENAGNVWDGEVKRDYSGLTALTGEKTVKALTAKAEHLVAEFEANHDTEELWRRINAATKQTLRKGYESGMMNRETYEKVRDMFEYYIPLRGWDTDVAADEYEYLNSPRPMLPPALKTAEGRKSISDDPIATIAFMANAEIVRGNRNVMKQHFFNLVLNNPTSVATVSEQWYTYNNVKEEWNPDNPVIPIDATADEIDAILKEHEQKMRELQEQGLATRRRSRLNLGLHTTKYEGQEHVVRVMRGGKEFCIYINGNPRAAQAINGMTNPNTAYNTPAMRFLERVKNFQARAYTSLSPMFIFTNLSRDVIMAGTAVAIKENGAYTKQYSKNITKALTTAMLPRLVKKYKAGKLDMNIEEERYFNEFVMNGGETGFTRLLGMEDYKKDLEKKLQKLQGKQSIAGKAFETVADGVEFMNRSVEDTTRFMVYMTSRQMGRDVRRSIWDAKEITVNFNKKGSGGFLARELSLWYIFFNAAVQSVANFGKLMAKNPGKTTVALAAFSSAGMLVPLLNMTVQALLGDDDELEYWDLPEWVRRNNLVIWLPGGYVTIPLPHELRPFYGMGEAAMACILGKAEVGETLGKVALGFSDMLPLDFTGNGGNILVNLIPTISQPIVQVAMNVDYFGKPIYRDNDWNKEDPEWTKAYKGTSTWLVNGTKWLNEISGGNNIKSGYIDLNPAWIEHLFESYTGGMGKTFNKMMKTVSMLWNEDAREVRNVPVVSSFYQTSEERTVDRALNEKYHKALDELYSYNHLMRGYKKEAGKGLFEYAKLYSDLVESNEYKRAEIIKYFKKRVDEIEDYLENNKLTPEERTKAENDMRDAKLMMFDELDNVNK